MFLFKFFYPDSSLLTIQILSFVASYWWIDNTADFLFIRYWHVKNIIIKYLFWSQVKDENCIFFFEVLEKRLLIEPSGDGTCQAHLAENLILRRQVNINKL